MAAATSVISGAGNSAYALKSGRTAASMMGDAFAAALDASGLKKSDIDGLISQGGMDYDMIGWDFGLETRYCLQTWSHGRMTGPAIMTASAVIGAGLAKHVLCIHARAGNSGFGGAGDREGGREGGGPHGEVPYYGLTAPACAAAFSWRKYVHDHHADPLATRHIVLNQRRNAAQNPDAVLRDQPMTEQAYLAEPLIIEPLRRADFALPNDGAAAVIVSAAGETRHGVPLIGFQGMAGGRSEQVFAIPGMGLGFQDDAEFAPMPEVYGKAGVKPSDIDVVAIYDSFSPSVILELERFRHSAVGRGWDWVANDRLAPDGELPVNTSGGHIAESGLSGWNHMVELYRQLTGAAGPRQVKNARLGQYISPNGCSLIMGTPS